MSVASEYAERAGIDGIDGIELTTGSVLELPYEDDSFDIVMLSGVLHATVDWKRGVAEMLRVLRPGGTGLIMHLNENPGGLFWDVLEITRVIMFDESHSFARHAIELTGVAPERIIQVLDPAIVPINVRPSTDEIETCLGAAGARELRRFLRGADSDRVERVFRAHPHAKTKFGIGENRYLFVKSG